MRLCNATDWPQADDKSYIIDCLCLFVWLPKRRVRYESYLTGLVLWLICAAAQRHLIGGPAARRSPYACASQEYKRRSRSAGDWLFETFGFPSTCLILFSASC